MLGINDAFGYLNCLTESEEKGLLGFFVVFDLLMKSLDDFIDAKKKKYEEIASNLKDDFRKELKIFNGFCEKAKAGKMKVVYSLKEGEKLIVGECHCFLELSEKKINFFKDINSLLRFFSERESVQSNRKRINLLKELVLITISKTKEYLHFSLEDKNSPKNFGELFSEKNISDIKGFKRKGEGDPLIPKINNAHNLPQHMVRVKKR